MRWSFMEYNSMRPAKKAVGKSADSVCAMDKLTDMTSFLMDVAGNIF